MQLNEIDKLLLQLDEWLDKYGDTPIKELEKTETNFLKKSIWGIISCPEFKDDAYMKRLEKYILPNK